VVCNAYRPAELIATLTPEIHPRAPQAQITTPKDKISKDMLAFMKE
jgi:hypothetical protein